MIATGNHFWLDILAGIVVAAVAGAVVNYRHVRGWFARPVPAMSNAVPWSGAVRTIGSPSVTLTASSKWIALTGISAWSWYMHKAAS